MIHDPDDCMLYRISDESRQGRGAKLNWANFLLIGYIVRFEKAFLLYMDFVTEYIYAAKLCFSTLAFCFLYFFDMLSWTLSVYVSFYQCKLCQMF